MGEISHRMLLSEHSFGALLQSTQSDVLAFVCHIVGNRDDAHDVAQDVYVRAWRAAQRGDPPFVPTTSSPADTLDLASIRRWLFHVAYRQAVTWLRHRAVIPWESFDSEEDDIVVVTPIGQTAEAPFEDRIIEEAVLQAAFARLKRADAACLWLDIVQGFSTAEIAKTLGIAPNAARKRLSRAMERLRAAYFAQEVEPGRMRKGMSK